MATPNTIAATRTASTRAVPWPRRSQIGRSCMPMSTNASAFSTKTTVSQTARMGTRMRAGMRGPPPRAIVIAKATIVRMPDSPAFSASIQTPKVQANWRMSDVGTCSGALVSGRSMNARPTPAATLPNTVSRKTGR